VAPREDDAKWFAYNRARPMLDDSPALARHKPTVSDDLTRLEWNLPRMFVRFVGANSPAALSQMPIRYLFLDEVDKYPAFSGREADPIKLAGERQGTFWNAKSVLASTPTTRNGNVWKYYEQSQQLICHVPCPHCGRWLVMSLAQTKWPGGADPADIRRHKLAWYECQHCGGRIDDLGKLQMLARCVWAPRDHQITEDDIERGHVPFDSQVGFWLPRFYSPWLSGTFGSIACEFLQSKNDPPRLMNFVNSWLAETWQEKVEANTTDALAEHQAGYPQGMVAQGAMVLTAGVDVQMSSIYFVIRAWGAGWESWLVRAGRVETWQELEAELFLTKYPVGQWGETEWAVDEHTSALGVRLACIDARYRKDEVHAFVRKWRDVARAVLGRDHLGGNLYSLTRLDKDATGRAITGGRHAWHVDVSVFKDRLSRFIHAGQDDLGQWHLPADLPSDYLAQMCSEEKAIVRNKRTLQIKEEWVLVSAAAPNHYWDCEVYAAAAADMQHVAALRPGGKPTVYVPHAVSAPAASGPARPREREDTPYRAGGTGPWLQRRGRWMR